MEHPGFLGQCEWCYNDVLQKGSDWTNASCELQKHDEKLLLCMTYGLIIEETLGVVLAEQRPCWTLGVPVRNLQLLRCECASLTT